MPYYFLLIAYGLIILIGVFFFLTNLYHLIRFGFFDFTAKVNTILVIGIFIIVLIFSIFFLRHIDWLATWEFNPNLSLNKFK